MSATIPPSEEVVLKERQVVWDARKKRTDFWLSFMSGTVCALILLPMLGLTVWYLAPIVEIIAMQERSLQAIKPPLSNALERAVITIVIGICVHTLFGFLRRKMDAIRWTARARLGDRPSDTDDQSDDYEMQEIDLVEFADGSFLATVNGWQFNVELKLNRIADGMQRMDFSFSEASGRKDLWFGSFVVMDEFHRETKHEVIQKVLSKMVTVYSELQEAPPAGHYSDQ